MPKPIRKERMQVYSFRCFPSLMKKFDKATKDMHYKSRSDAFFHLIRDHVLKNEEEQLQKQKQAG